jgi:SnoaL-like domain
MKNFFAALIMITAMSACQNQKNPKDPQVPVLPTDDRKGSIHKFLDTYARLISEGNYDSLPFLYDTLGAIFIGDNKMIYEPMDSLISRYHSYRNLGKSNFAFDSTEVQLLDSTVALVTTLFNWNFPPSKDTTTVFYTGLLIRQRGKWKIKHEHETVRIKERSRKKS